MAIKGFKEALVYCETGVKKLDVSFLEGRFSFRGGNDLVSLPQGYFLAPGLIDEHIHGANGFDTMDASFKSLEGIATSLLQEGVTSFCPTTMTVPSEEIEKALINVKDYMAHPSEKGAKVLGVHLEGPFISKKYHGAQNEKDILLPNVEKMKKFVSLSGHNIRITTFAYEEEGGEVLLRYLLSEGIVPSIGHSDCSGKKLHEGIEKGISCVTHLFNAQRGIHHRDIGIPGVAMEGKINCEVICDYHHLSPECVALIKRHIPLERIVLITDSLSGKYLPHGTPFYLGGNLCHEEGGVARLENGTIAGSLLSLNKGVRLFSEGIERHLALNAASINVAKNLGIEKDYGSIAEGKYADFSIMDKDFNVYMTFVNGRMLYKKEGFSLL